MRVSTTLEELEPRLRDAIRPFFKKDKLATNDLLNDVQRAFVKYRSKQVMQTGDSINYTLAKQVIKEGINERLWNEGFKPEGTDDFEKYIYDRLKNEKKAIQKKELIANQKARLSQYISEGITDDSILPVQ